MSIAESLLGQLVYEAANTRKVLERLPEAHMTWRPHEKSFSLGDLASHVAETCAWVRPTLEMDELDIASGEYSPKRLIVVADVVALHDASVKDAVQAMQGVTDERMLQLWRLKAGDQVLLELPRAAVVQSMVISHTIHHRGQLTVYLRMKDVPLPGIYGPSADEH